MKNKMTIKKLCMIEAVIACNEVGKDYLIDTPIFKEIYTEIYKAVVSKEKPKSWNQLSEYGKKHFCEHVISTVKTTKFLQEDSGGPAYGVGTGAAVGAGVGALGAAGVWAVKRLQLRKKMQQCPDEACKAQVQQQIGDLRRKALMGGAAAAAGGAALGAGTAAAAPQIATMDQGIRTAANDLGNRATGAVNAAGNWAGDQVEKIPTADDIKSNISTGVEGIKTKAAELGNQASGAVQKVGNWAGDQVEKIPTANAITTGAANLGNRALGAVHGGADWIGSQAEKAFATPPPVPMPPNPMGVAGGPLVNDFIQRKAMGLA